MFYLLFIIITLLIAVVYSIITRINQAEQYHLENKYPLGKNKTMDKAMMDRNEKLPKMIWSGFVSTMMISTFISIVIFGILFGLDYFGIINFLTK